MARIREWVSRLWGTFRGRRTDRDLEEELRLHLELAAEDEAQRTGLPGQARRTAQIRAGGVAQAVEAMRDQRGLPWLENLTRDFRYGWRILTKHPSFSLLTVVMLALGIGACTAIFTVVNGVLLRPLPYPDPDSLVQLWELSDTQQRMRLPEANFADWKAGSRSFDEMAMFTFSVQPILGGTEPIRARVAEVSRGFFDVLKVEPVMGTVFLADHLRPDATPSAIVGYGFWARAFGSDPNPRGRRLTFQGSTYTVIGVMPLGFDFPQRAEVWIPREVSGRPMRSNRSSHNWSVVARLRPGTSAGAATADVDAIAKRIHREYTDVTAVGAVAVPLKEQLTQPVGTALEILFAGVGLLLLIACTNVAHLLLAHASARQTELAVRTALGASPGSLRRLFLSQTLLLAAVGGALGVLLSLVGVDALLALGSQNLPRADEIRVDGRVLSFALLLSLAVAVGLGVLPAHRAGRVPPSDALKEQGRRASSGRAAGVGRAPLVVQVALTVVLLVSAVLLGKSLVRLLDVDLGFQTENRLAIDVLLPEERDLDARQRDAGRYEEVLARVSGLPGITAVGGVGQLPLSGAGGNGQFQIEGGMNSGRYWPAYRVASPGYFAAMSIPLLRGRVFDSTDGAFTPQVAVISKTVADTVWPGQDPIGRRINYANFDLDQKFMTIVGIVADVRNAPDVAAFGDVYVHYLQRGPVDNFTLVADVVDRSALVAGRMASDIRSLIPEASVRVRTMDELYAMQTANRRFSFALLATFSGAALILAVIGIYGTTAYAVSQRTSEIGIRVALGARSPDVIRLFMLEKSKVLLIGVIIGLGGAAAASRVLQSLLFGVQATDPSLYVVAVLPLIVAGLVASLWPSWRAARLDPVRALRSE